MEIFVVTLAGGKWMCLLLGYKMHFGSDQIRCKMLTINKTLFRRPNVNSKFILGNEQPFFGGF